MRVFKIFFSVLFVAFVAILVVRSCVKPAVKPAKVRPVSATKTTRVPRVLPQEPATQPETVSGPRMAIILDDWGNNLPLLQKAIDLKVPVTLAVIPHLKHSQTIAAKAHEAGLAVILHMPMQPIKTKDKLEPETISSELSDEKILKHLRSAISAVPHIEGMNNHMGSAATADRRVMTTVLKETKAHELYFLDSNTNAQTVGWKVAKELGVATAKRDVFIDNIAKKDDIKKELLRAAALALKKGRSVVIGHDKKVTLQALAETLPEIQAKGVRLVFVRELLS